MKSPYLLMNIFHSARQIKKLYGLPASAIFSKFSMILLQFTWQIQKTGEKKPTPRGWSFKWLL